MSVLLDLWRNGTVDHDLSELVPLRPDVVHQHLVGGQGVFDGGLGVRVKVNSRMQLHSVCFLFENIKCPLEPSKAAQLTVVLESVYFHKQGTR